MGGRRRCASKSTLLLCVWTYAAASASSSISPTRLADHRVPYRVPPGAAAGRAVNWISKERSIGAESLLVAVDITVGTERKDWVADVRAAAGAEVARVAEPFEVGTFLSRQHISVLGAAVDYSHHYSATKLR